MGPQSYITVVFEEAVSERLRDVWTFDRETQTCLHMRPDVRAVTEDQDLLPFIDNERYGYITRLTYDELSHADYQYTVRGFDEFQTFRTFLQTADGSLLGVMASIDAGADVDFGAVYEALVSEDCYSHPKWSVDSDPGLAD